MSQKQMHGNALQLKIDNTKMKYTFSKENQHFVNSKCDCVSSCFFKNSNVSWLLDRVFSGFSKRGFAIFAEIFFFLICS